jgi:PST family polysaccharide transporter
VESRPATPTTSARPSGRLRAIAVRGMMWVGGERLGTRVVDQLFTIVLARLLVPSHFGTIALATVLTGFVSLFTYMGLGTAIIQRKEVDDADLSTAFWANISTGVVLFGVVAAASRLLGMFVQNSEVPVVASTLALRFVLAGGSVVQVALLSRQMNYRALSVRTILSTLVGGVVAVTLAYAGAGVWALVGQALTTTVVSTIALYVATGWRPKRIFSWERFRSLFSFGAPILISRMLNFSIRNVDNLLIGRFLGAQALGYYALGYTVFLAPLVDLGLIVNQVLFASLSRVQDESERLRRGFLDATEAVALVTLPMMVGLSLVAAFFVEVFFGARWLPSAPVISVLALAGFLRLLTTLGPAGLQAAGRPDLQLRWTVISILLYLPAFYVGLRWGIVGVATGYLIATAILTPIEFGFVTRVIGVRVHELVRALSPSVVGSAVMALVVWSIRQGLLALGLPKLVVLIVLIVAGIVSYLAAVWVLQRRALRRLVALVRGGLFSRSGRSRQPATPGEAVEG